MIQLFKNVEPEILRKNSAKWTTELLEVASQVAEMEAKAPLSEDEKLSLKKLKSKLKTKTSRYNHVKIKAGVISETLGKCAYCEGDVRAVSHGDIEHVFPKSLDYSRAFEWGNLTFACQLCNQEKSNKDPNHTAIIDPYQCDPKNYIQFFASFARAPGSIEGLTSIANLGLNRDGLIESRNEVIGSLSKEIVAIMNARSAAEKSALIIQFKDDHIERPSATFKAMRRDFWEMYKDKL